MVIWTDNAISHITRLDLGKALRKLRRNIQ